jgi:UDP-glucose 4-epimerase
MITRFLVTGGAGFIGSHLCDALVRGGAEVVVLDDFSSGRRENLASEVEVVEGSVLDEALLEQLAKGCTGIFHLAAVASVQRCNEMWVDGHRVNQTGTIAVLDASRSFGGIPVVYASSAAVYGDQGAGRIAETAERVPLSPYGADKLGSELHGRVAAALFGVPNIGLRFFNVYGPRQDPNSPYSGVISIFAARAAAGLPIAIHGDGLQTRDFVYVSDVVAHLVRAMEIARRPGGYNGVFNVCTGRGQSIAELARLVIALSASSSVISSGPPRAGDIRASVGDPQAARSALGLSADVSLQEGLRRLLDVHSPTE